jgi:hypothetical protein
VLCAKTDQFLDDRERKLVAPQLDISIEGSEVILQHVQEHHRSDIGSLELGAIKPLSIVIAIEIPIYPAYSS